MLYITTVISAHGYARRSLLAEMRVSPIARTRIFVDGSGSVNSPPEQCRSKAFTYELSVRGELKTDSEPESEWSLDDLRPGKNGDGEMGIEIADWSQLPDRLLLDSELHDILLA